MEELVEIHRVLCRRVVGPKLAKERVGVAFPSVQFILTQVDVDHDARSVGTAHETRSLFPLFYNRGFLQHADLAVGQVVRATYNQLLVGINAR